MSAVSTGILYIVMGILMIVFRAGMIKWALIIGGALMIIYGIYSIVQKKASTRDGVIMAIGGLVCVIGGWWFLEIALIVLGIVFIVKGFMDLIKNGFGKSGQGLIAPVVTIVVGVLLVVSRWALVDWLFIILGIVLIVDGILTLVGSRKA